MSALIRLLILLSLTNTAYADIGQITEQRGSAVVERQADELSAALALGIEMEDNVVTARGVVGITFEDDTEVRVGEHSELVIDDFVYDPNSNSGSLGFKVAFGAVAYTSGAIAHNNPNNVSINTPAATIAVRGTSFSTIVDEIGGSTVVLIPDRNGRVGVIDVITNMGLVTLDQAYQMTRVMTRDQIPSAPIIIDSNIMLDVSLNISPIRTIEAEQDNPILTALDINDLDVNLLDYNELDEDNLEFSELDVNSLDMVLLTNQLDMEELDESTDGVVAGFNTVTGVATIIEDTSATVIRASDSAYMSLTFEIDQGTNAAIMQRDTLININALGGDSTNNIRIIQR